MTTRFLLIGGIGQLGTDLGALLRKHKVDVTIPEREELDITHEKTVHEFVSGYDIIINAAAYTQVDTAETHEDDAHAVNAAAVKYLSHAAAASKARFITVSTDYVFDGTATTPYDEDAPHCPLGAYGRTKAAGEQYALNIYPQNAFIVRTSWLYGKTGPNFPQTMLKLAQTHERLQVVNDQIGQPTWSADLAQRIYEMSLSDIPPGIYHGTNSGQTSWYDFAREVFTLSGLDPERILPTDSSTFQRPAPRPAFSVLGHAGWKKAAMQPLRPWHEALRQASQNKVLNAQ